MVELKSVTKRFGSFVAVQDVNLDIKEGEFLTLLGPSGCGKSTFVRCLNRMHETNPIARATGTVKMGEIDIYKDASPVEIRRRVAMVDDGEIQLAVPVHVPQCRRIRRRSRGKGLLRLKRAVAIAQ